MEVDASVHPPGFAPHLLLTVSLRSRCAHWLWQSVLLDLCAGVLRMTLLRCPKFLRCLTADAGNFDRGHSLTSLPLPPAALSSLPTSARPPHYLQKNCHCETSDRCHWLWQSVTPVPSARRPALHRTSCKNHVIARALRARGNPHPPSKAPLPTVVCRRFFPSPKAIFLSPPILPHFLSKNDPNFEFRLSFLPYNAIL